MRSEPPANEPKPLEALPKGIRTHRDLDDHENIEQVEHWRENSKKQAAADSPAAIDLLDQHGQTWPHFRAVFPTSPHFGRKSMSTPAPQLLQEAKLHDFVMKVAGGSAMNAALIIIGDKVGL
jgi:hypothetical protein